MNAFVKRLCQALSFKYFGCHTVTDAVTLLQGLLGESAAEHAQRLSILPKKVTSIVVICSCQSK